MSESAWSNEAWVTTEAAAAPPSGGEYAGMTPTRVVATADQLRDACQTAVAGDTIGVDPAVYVGTQQEFDASQKREAPAFYPRNSGTASNPIIFVAKYPAVYGEGAVSDIRSGSTTDGTAVNVGGWPAFGCRYNDYCQWIGMYSSGMDSNNKWTYDAAPASIYYGRDNKISLCKLVGNDNDFNNGKRNYAAVSLRYTTNPTVSDCWMEDFFGQGGQTNSAGIIFYYAKNFVVDNNHIKRCTHGLQYKGGSDDDALYGSTRYNLIENCVHGFRWHSYGPGPTGQRSAMQQNLIINTTNFLESTTGSGGFRDIDMANNTFSNGNNLEAGSLNYYAATGTPTGMTFKNNIHSGTKTFMGSYNIGVGTLDSMCASSYNCITDPQYMTNPENHSLSSWRSQTGQETGSITSDPQFVGGGDYRLQSGSPCRGTGESGVNMGCYITGNETIGIR